MMINQLTTEEIRNKMEKIVKTHEKLVHMMITLRRETSGMMDFGAYNESDEIMITNGVDLIADAFDTRVEEKEAGIEIFPFQYETTVGHTLITQLEQTEL